MKPFDLEEAKAGKPVCTRNGLSARIICFDVKREYYPMVTVIENKGEEFVASHNLDGRYCNDKDDDLDLFMSPEKHEGWGWLSKCSCVYTTKREALANKHEGAFLAKIEWEE